MSARHSSHALEGPVFEALEPRVLLSTTYYVDQKNPLAKDTNPGTEVLPLLTITKAAGKVAAGDTILIKEGIYREEVALTRSGSAGLPITMKGAAGQRVVISGADALTGWTQATLSIAKNNPNWSSIYYVDINWKPPALFQDDVPLEKARTGAYHWWVVQGGGADGLTVNDSVNLTQPADYWNGAEIFYWRLSGTSHYVRNIVDYAPGVLSLDSVLYTGVVPASGDRYWLQNKVELISAAGQWAVEQTGTSTYRVYAWAAGGGDADDHLMEASRRSRFNIEWGGQSYWTFDNLELTKDSGHGIGGWTGTSLGHFTIQNCSIHHNGGTGIYGRFNGGGVYQDNYVAYNGFGAGGTGINVSDSPGVRIENNEIAFNGNDGIDITTSDVTLRGNYIHGNWYWGHADNAQCWGGITNLLVEDNFIVDGGQGFMMEGVSGVTYRNNVIMGSRAYLIIAGHNTTDHLNLYNNTLGFSLYGILNNAGDYYDFRDNIEMPAHNTSVYGSGPTQHYASDYNLFYKADGISQNGIVVWNNNYNLTLAQYVSQSAQDAHSLYANPKFASAPAQYFILDGSRFLDHTPTRVYLGTSDMGALAVGDHIEIDWDGVVRTITAKGSNYVDFSPAKPTLPLRSSVLTNWKTKTNFALDFSLAAGSPALGKGSTGGNLGAGISTLNFAKGDFNGDGLRDIPRWPVVRGDINRDGAADAGDIDYLYSALRAHSTDGTFDLTHDGSVGQGDADLLVRTYLASQYGDANLDGRVDSADLGILGGHWHAGGAGWARGDFSGDGNVDVADLGLLGKYWQWQRPPGGGGSPGLAGAAFSGAAGQAPSLAPFGAGLAPPAAPVSAPRDPAPPAADPAPSLAPSLEDRVIPNVLSVGLPTPLPLKSRAIASFARTRPVLREVRAWTAGRAGGPALSEFLSPLLRRR